MPPKRKYRTRSKKGIGDNRKCPLENVPKVIFKINHSLYPGTVTRRLAKVLDGEGEFRDFIIVETYRCMPLLGNEEEQAPDWTVHYVRYDIVFIDKQ